MKKSAGDQTISKLIEEGWRVSHSALVSRYRYAGTVSEMRPRNGRQYCRVHHGRCVGNHTWQITTVMYRDIV